MEWLARFGPIPHALGRLWPLWLAFALTSGPMAVAAATGLERLWLRWTDYPYNHAAVIVVMSAWLAIDAIRRGGVARPYPSTIGGVGLASTLAAYLAFEQSDATLAMQAMLPLMLLALAATIAGLSVGRRLAIPILFLYFAIPVWDLMIPPLQATTVAAVSTVLQWTGFTAFIEGTLIHIPAGTFEVAEGCAGLRYFIVSLTLASFYGLLYLRTWKKGLALIGVALASAMLCNWIRVYSLVVIGDLTQMQHYLIAVSHSRFGWVIYALSLIPVFAFAIFLENRNQAPGARPASVALEVSSPYPYLVAAALASALLLIPSLLRT